MFRKALASTFLYFFFLASGLAKIVLPDVISSNMVLQREAEVPIWGKANAGESISVEFSGQIHTVITNDNGHWKILLSPMPVNAQAETMTISGEDTLYLENILVGEVWVCAGQSNMQWTVEQSEGGTEAIAKANFSNIRLFNVSREIAFKKEEGKLATWKVCSPESVGDFSGVGYFFALDLYQKMGVPVGMINSSFGGSQAEAWTPVEYLAASEDLLPCIKREKIWKAERPQVKREFDKKIADWKIKAKEAESNGVKPPRKPRVPDALREYRIAASIYDSMIEPLIPYRIRGALWYQGESNEARAEQYLLLMKTMIRAWRERWGQGDFPLAIVQLPNFRSHSPQPTDEAWSHLRDAQRKVFLETPNTGLIVTIDIGEADDIHPTNKLDVANRLFRWALAEVYQHPGSNLGPVFSKVKLKKKKAVLYFSETGKGLRSIDGKPLQEFALAGQDKKWYWAKAKIKGKKKVLVWSEEVPDPKAVRYAFNNNPVNPNLTNDSGIPASPFRTDNWAGPTDGKR